MSLREKAVKGVAWSAVQNWGSNLITTAVLLILANLLEVETFGLVAFASVFTAFLHIFQRQGFAQALIQRADLEPGHLSTAFWTSAVSGLLLTIGLVAASGLVSQCVDKPELTPVLQWLSLTLLIDALGNTPQAILRRNLAFKSLAMRSLVASLAGGVVGVGMALHGFGIWSLVGQRLTASLAGTITLWIACDWRPCLAVSFRHFRDLFGFGVYAMGNETVAFFNRQMPDLLIGTFLGMTALGYYTVGYRLLLIMTQMFTQTVSAVALPTFSRLQHDHAQMRQALLTATRMTSLAAFPAFMGMAVLAPELVLGLIGDKWDRSVPIMQILAFIGIVHSVTFFNGPAIIACGKPSWAFALALSNAMVNVTVFVVAVHWGIIVVAAAFVIRGYAYAPFPLLTVRKLIGLNVTRYVRQLVAPVIGTVVMVLVVWATKHALETSLNTRELLGVSILAGVFVYILTMRLIAPGHLRQAMDYIRLALASRTSTDT